MLFASTSKNEALIPYFKKKKNSFEYLKELESILLFLSFL